MYRGTYLRCVFLTVCILLLIHPGRVFADWSFHLSNTGMDATWEIRLVTDEALDIYNYGLAWVYDHDPGFLEWGGGYENTPPAGMLAEAFGPPVETTPGEIWRFDALALPGHVTVPESLWIGSLTFHYGQGRTPDPGDVSWNAQDPRFSVNVNGVDYTGNALLEGGHLAAGPVAAVPLPAGALLLFSGVAGLAGMRGNNGNASDGASGRKSLGVGGRGMQTTSRG